MDAVGFVGVGMLEAKRHAETGELVIIEINVRLPQGFGLGDASGADASWRLYSSLAGLPLGRQPQQHFGAKVLIPYFDALCLRRLFARREITVREVLHSYRGVRDVGVLDPRDPVPMMAFAWWLARRIAGAPRGRT
jgi:predicted ATP-grasp superfamily ATP-dependent carboligase